MSRQNIALVAFLAIVCAGAAGFGAFKMATRKPAAPLPVLGTLPAFSLTDQHGSAITEADLRGKVWIANFIFTRCPTVCPVSTQRMRKLQDRTGERIHLISFSVDPEYDTPERLATYGEKFGAKDNRWLFVTGDPAAITATVTGGLKLSVSRQGQLSGGIPNIVHDLHFVLIDEKLQIRGYYDSTDPARLAALARDAIALARAADRNATATR
ncbi:MAG TPA: SCO family protein [Kofleriaceae bacterium]|nr:SCO family protein [Kofleriaceae bacterium]